MCKYGCSVVAGAICGAALGVALAGEPIQDLCGGARGVFGALCGEALRTAQLINPIAMGAILGVTAGLVVGAPLVGMTFGMVGASAAVVGFSARVAFTEMSKSFSRMCGY